MKVQSRGLLGEFSNLSELNREVWKAIEHDVVTLDLGVPVLATNVSVDLLVQPKQERELSGVDAGGKSKYTTRHCLQITNQGSMDAEEVRYEAIGETQAYDW
jgi:hypothetical protein